MEAGHDHEVAADGADLLMRILAWCLAAIAVAVVVAGCGSSSKSKQDTPKPVSSALVVAAATKSTQPGSAEADFKIAGPGIKGTGSGVFNTRRSRSGQLHMTVSLNGLTEPIDSVIAGNDLYMRSPLFSQLNLSGGKAWVKVDLGELAKERGVDLSNLVSTSPTPATALSYLRGADRVEQVGSDAIDGVDTTHYKATVDLERAAARNMGETRRALQRVIHSLGMKKVPVDVWVDGKGYVRKVGYAQRVAQGRSVRIVMNLHDFGPPVPVKPPPADSVVDLMTKLGR
jgi:hypothetical protein